MTSSPSISELVRYPLLYCVLTYVSVATSLYLETGSWHIGTSYPVLFGSVVLLVSLTIEDKVRS